jgi:C4-dicarboxylate-specific signal transduction histidine kinase
MSGYRCRQTRGDRRTDRLRQVLHNLIRDTIDAQADVSEPLRHHARAAGDQVALISPTGSGFSMKSCGGRSGLT